MKNILFILSVIIMSTNNYAQLRKGLMMVGGSINYSQNTNNGNDSLFNVYSNDDKNTQLNFGLKFGYFITDKIVVGIIGNYQNSNRKYSHTSGLVTSSNYSSYNTNQTSNSYSGGLFLRYYKMINKGDFGFFCQLSANYGIGKTTLNDISSGSTTYNDLSHGTTSLFNVWLNPGLIYFVTNKIGIETTFGSIGYSAIGNKNFSKYNQTGSGTNTSFNANFNLTTLYIGINYFFGGSKTGNQQIPKQGQ